MSERENPSHNLTLSCTPHQAGSPAECACPKSCYELKGPASDFQAGANIAKMCVRQEDGVSIRTVACVCPSSEKGVTSTFDPYLPLDHVDYKNFGLEASYDSGAENLTVRDLFCHQYASWNDASVKDTNHNLWGELCSGKAPVQLDHPSYYFNDCERTFAPINRAQAIQIASIETNQNKEQHDVERRT
jgi:hypothetical protein